MMRGIVEGAGVALRQQVEIFGGDAISLDHLWRSSGSPFGKDPRTWTELASPLIAGFAAYLTRVAGPRPAARGEQQPLIWEWSASDSDPWRRGDLMSIYLLARIYAAFLDQGERAIEIPKRNRSEVQSRSAP
jgi:hypothetical protein